MKFRWRLGHTMEQVIKKRLQQVMDASVAKGETPGCLLMVIKDGEEQVYLESGYADIEAKKPVSRDNIFRLYSMSKPITATAMMILVERGIVDLASGARKNSSNQFHNFKQRDTDYDALVLKQVKEWVGQQP